VLSQSYRVPRAVHALALRLVRGLTRRQPKDYMPRDADGRVRRCSARFKRPEAMLDDLERQLRPGAGAWCLASCAYIARPYDQGVARACDPILESLQASPRRLEPTVPRQRRDNTALDRILAFLQTDPEARASPRTDWDVGRRSRCGPSPWKARSSSRRGSKRHCASETCTRRQVSGTWRVDDPGGHRASLWPRSRWSAPGSWGPNEVRSSFPWTWPSSVASHSS